MTADAAAPAEARGLARDEVRLLVARPTGSTDTVFRDLPAQLRAGDLVVVNTSKTLPAALDGWREDGSEVVVHFATALDDGTWIVEVRPAGISHGPVSDIRVGERIALPTAARVEVLETRPGQVRLHRVAVAVEGPVTALLERRGRPIAYGYVPDRWPLADYQTIFASEPGSAEMPSAGRPFTPQVVTDLARRGVLVAPVLLHTGVSSPELGEPPSAERFRVPAATAALVQHVRSGGGRVVAVGTTVTRALETVACADGTVRAGQGWTELVMGPDRPARIVDGVVTGWHEPGGSHVRLLEAVAGAALVRDAYERAGRKGYLWHEFGDSCLLLPDTASTREGARSAPATYAALLEPCLRDGDRASGSWRTWQGSASPPLVGRAEARPDRHTREWIWPVPGCCPWQRGDEGHHARTETQQLAEHMQTAMRSRAVIDQAKEILMAQRHCTAEEAFDVLIGLSQSSHRKLREVAQALVDATTGRG